MTFMSRVSLAFLTTLLIASATVEAQQVSGFVEEQNVVTGTDVTPQMDAYVHGPLKGRFGWSLYTQTSRPWGQTYAGLTFAPAKWVELSGSAGLERDDSPFRYAGSVWLGMGRWSLLSIGEDGGSGHWHKNLGVFQATKTVGVGVLNQAFFGTGPYAEVKIRKVTLWGAYAVADKQGLIAAKFNF